MIKEDHKACKTIRFYQASATYWTVSSGNQKVVIKFYKGSEPVTGLSGSRKSRKKIREIGGRFMTARHSLNIQTLYGRQA